MGNHYLQSSVTGRVRIVDDGSLTLALRDNGGEFTEITAAAAAALVHYVRNKAGTVSNIYAADLPAALAAGGVEVSAAVAQAANPQLFGKADPAVLQSWRPYARDAAGNVYVPTLADPRTAANYPGDPNQ